MRLVLAACALMLATSIAYAQADYAREKRWAEEITPSILVGDPVYLELKTGKKFLAIYAPHPKPLGGVILVHGLGVHPDWGLINPLRSQLAEQGFSTLSVQMPVLAAEARSEQYPPLFPEATERLAVAVGFLDGKGLKRIAIVSHSLGARMTNHFFNSTPKPGVHAWVAIGILGLFTEPATIGVPVLDLFGEKELPAVLQGAERLRRCRLRGSADPGSRGRSLSPATRGNSSGRCDFSERVEVTPVTDPPSSRTVRNVESFCDAWGGPGQSGRQHGVGP
jgi:pimeloyl-ACP methyl ester carboxylesterase